MTTSNKTMPNLNTEIAIVRILDLPLVNSVVLNLLRANANVMIAEKLMMDLMNPNLKQTSNQIGMMELDIRSALTVAKELANAFIVTMIWIDNTYDHDASQMRRAYEQIRDGIRCIEDYLTSKGSYGLRQASCEFSAGVINYFMAIGYTDPMAIESAAIEFKNVYEGSKI